MAHHAAYGGGPHGHAQQPQPGPSRGYSNGTPQPGPPPANGARHPAAAAAAAAPPPLSQPIRDILSLGAERNLQHAQSLGLVAMNGQQPVPGPRAIQAPSLIKLDKETELCWVAAGRAAERMGNIARAIVCYESVITHNPQNPDALQALANLHRVQEDYHRGADYYTRALAVNETDGEMWGALGHCYLMTDDLPRAYNCYQQAIINTIDSKNEPKLWYGIGILYDRYGSLEHAEEAFASVIKMDPSFDRANEVYFRLGIIYKQQKNSRASLQCFQYILSNPPRPLTEIDIWFQIGHVYEQQQDFDLAKDAYDRVLHANPNHAKVLQQLGGLYQRKRASFYDPDRSVTILTKSLEHDPTDAFSWYLLGRAYMTAGNFGKAYEAYQQAVYRDGKNPAFWCSIGVLYCNINQFHDSLDAYSRAIRINPYLSEVWFNLGALYESCNDQMSDAVDAYQRTLQLDSGNTIVQSRLNEIRIHQSQGTPLTAPPQPRDISPSSQSWAYASQVNGPPNGFAGEATNTDQASPRANPNDQSGGHHGPLPDARFGPPQPSNGPPYSSQNGNGGPQQYRSNGFDPTRRSSGGPFGPPPPPTADRGRPPPSSSDRPSSDRPSLPQIRSYHDGDHLHQIASSVGPSPHHYPHPPDVPPEHLRGKPANKPPPPLRMGSPYNGYDHRSDSPTTLRRSPPQHPAGRPPASAPALPPYGRGDDRRWAAEEEERRARSAHGPPPPQQAGPPGSRGPSPTTMRTTPSAAARRQADEDYDEGADTLLALASSGGSNSGPNSATMPSLVAKPASPTPAPPPAVAAAAAAPPVIEQSTALPTPPTSMADELTKPKEPSGLTVKLKRVRSPVREQDEDETPTKKSRNEEPADTPTEAAAKQSMVEEAKEGETAAAA